MLNRRMAILLGACGAAGAAWAQTPEDAYQGEWHGVLQAGPARLRLRLVVEGFRATLFSVDQGNAEIAAETVDYPAGAIAISFPSIGANYSGRYENGRIAGTFTQGAAIALVFHREAASAAAAGALTEERLEELRARGGSPALAAASSNRDGGGVSFAVGLRSVNAAARVTTDDVWHLGSISKSMTATLVARAVEAGVVRWDDTAGGVLGGAAAQSACANATFLHLLSHRAGLQGNLPGVRLLAYRRENPAPMEERRRFAMEALAMNPAGPAEETFVYANNGYVIAAAMLEARLEAPWEDLIRTRLFEPLGMASAGFGAPGHPGALDQPVGHAAGAGGLVPFPPGSPVTDNVAALGPAGRVHASLGDLLKFAAAHRDETALLSRASWEALRTPPFGGEYALGLLRRGESLWHNGHNSLWYAEMIVDRGRGIAAAAATNDGRVDVAAAPVGEALIGAAAGAV